MEETTDREQLNSFSRIISNITLSSPIRVTSRKVVVVTFALAQFAFVVLFLLILQLSKKCRSSNNRISRTVTVESLLTDKTDASFNYDSMVVIAGAENENLL